MLHKLSYELLSEIEKKELSLLNWGFYNFTSDAKIDFPRLFSLERLNTPKWKEFTDKIEWDNQVISESILRLVDEKLLFTPFGLDSNKYRSRFAETVRLIAMLRQIFNESQWQIAPSLVKDVRIILNPRKYPKRNFSFNESLLNLKSNNVEINSREIDAFKSLLNYNQPNSIQLSHFQLDAFKNLFEKTKRGVVICAGTGSGKTKAFYLPALSKIAPLKKDGKDWTKIIAVYPRKELLKDQVRECISEAYKLKESFFTDEQKPLRVGVYYGDTPYKIDTLLDKKSRKKYFSEWEEAGIQQLKCPMFSCPSGECKGELLWSLDDIQAHNEKLVCNKCGFTLWADEITLTRDRICEEPPDILFITAEMLNRLIRERRSHKLLGINVNNPYKPKFILLDEIHTYEGIQGAHVAYLIRRLIYASKNYHCKITGLSATLNNPIDFFSSLTGIKDYHLEVVSPREQDLIEEGIEYNLAVKGNPASITSLLSTSIQILMLQSRLINDIRNPNSKSSASGKKIFAFADRLDTVSRWIDKLIDADNHLKLANIRRRTTDNQLNSLKNQQGQLWYLSEDMGFRLNNSLNISSISSLDPGIDNLSSIIIASPSLEVGYDDPEVISVVQHKSPRDQASFIQRKGRAGRKRNMRPWTIVILSDYGKDRWTFDNCEQLFSADISPLKLPLKNYYIQKIQAAFCLFDWLSIEKGSFDSWRNLTKLDSDYVLNIKETISSILSATDSKEFKSLTSYIKEALKIADDELSVILWEQPRSIVLEYLPSLWNRTHLYANCDSLGLTKDEIELQNPAPNYLPNNLFSHLSLPEVGINMEGFDSKQYLSISNALSEFIPGKVSKRYSSLTNYSNSYWLPIKDAVLNGEEVIDVNDFFQGSFNKIGKINYQDEIFPYYRPNDINLRLLDSQVSDTSSASYEWFSKFIFPVECRICYKVAAMNNISNLFTEMQSYLNRNNEFVKVSRVAVGVKYDLRTTDTNNLNRYGNLKFSLNSKSINRIGIGYDIEVDGIRIKLNTPSIDDLRMFFVQERNNDIVRRFRPDYFKYVLTKELVNNNLANPFFAEWIWQCEISALTYLATTDEISLSAAFENIKSSGRINVYDIILDILLHLKGNFDEHDSRLRDKIIEFISNIEKIEILNNIIEKCLINELEDEFYNWTQERILSTIRSIVLQSIIDIVPDIDENDISIDIENGNIIITENSLGGVGYIESFSDKLNSNPSAFFNNLENALYDCPTEVIDGEIRVFLSKYKSDPELKDICNVIRNSVSLSVEQVELAKNKLISKLNQLGIKSDRQFVVALNTYLLKSGMNEVFIEIIEDLKSDWELLNSKLGVYVDKRVFSLYSANKYITRFKDIFNGDISIGHAYNIINNILWSECKDVCASCLNWYSSFSKYEPPSRELLIRLLEIKDESLNFDSSDNFTNEIRIRLIKDHYCEIASSHDQLKKLKLLLIDFQLNPIDINYQNYFPFVSGIRKRKNKFIVKLVIKEFMVE